MSTNGTEDRDDHGAPTAAEYVLGVLDAVQRRAVEQRLAGDAAFAREVSFWEQRLGPLAEAVPPIAPPQDGWARIERALVSEAPVAKRRAGVWNNLPLWRGLALASAALAAGCIAALVYLVDLTGTVSPLVARLDEQSGQPGFVAASNPHDGSVTIVPAALLGQAQRSLELWVIPPGGKPHSLGLVDPDRPVKVQVPPALKPYVSANSTLAITLEPLGGSPTGDPTGPIVAKGALAAL
jgi:anti-sigma-K factor RskA